MYSIANHIEDIMSANKGKIFSINDFYMLGTKNTIKSILYRLNEENKITRLIDGLYTKPKFSKFFNEYTYPDVDEIAQKIAEKFSWNITPAADTALNYTGLSTQVPNEYIYISDGEYRKYQYRGKTITFKRTSNRNIANYSKELAILIQAIKALGKKNISGKEIQRLARFAKNIKEDLCKDTVKISFWMQEILKKIKEENHEQNS